MEVLLSLCFTHEETEVQGGYVIFLWSCSVMDAELGQESGLTIPLSTDLQLRADLLPSPAFLLLQNSSPQNVEVNLNSVFKKKKRGSISIFESRAI